MEKAEKELVLDFNKPLKFKDTLLGVGKKVHRIIATDLKGKYPIMVSILVGNFEKTERFSLVTALQVLENIPDIIPEEGDTWKHEEDLFPYCIIRRKSGKKTKLVAITPFVNVNKELPDYEFDRMIHGQCGWKLMIRHGELYKG